MVRKAILCMLLCLVIAAIVQPGQAKGDEVPVISLVDLKARMDHGEKVVLLNPLADILFNEGFIPGSINIPIKQLATTDKLPSDKETVIVTYCLGPQ